MHRSFQNIYHSWNLLNWTSTWLVISFLVYSQPTMLFIKCKYFILIFVQSFIIIYVVIPWFLSFLLLIRYKHIQSLYSSVLWCPLQFRHKNDVRFFFSSSFCMRVHVLFMLFLLFAHSGIQHILCCVFVFVSSSCVPYVASFSG